MQSAILRGCHLRDRIGTFLSLEGDATRHVVLMSCELSRAGTVAQLAPSVPQGALMQPAK